MADRRRIITLSPGGRAILELDLEVGGTFQAIAGTFAYQPGQANPQTSREPGRYGGQSTVGEQADNGTVAWQALVQGATADVVAANTESLLSSANRTAYGRKLEWRPDGSTYSSFFRIAGSGTWKPTYQWAQWQGARSMVVEISFPVRPLVDWDPVTISDPFDVDSTSDYTIDAAGGTTAITGDTVTASTNLTSERRWRHTVRGYKTLEGQGTLYAQVGTTLSGYKAGVLLRASASDTYVEVYVDDNGTNSRLRVDVIISGTRTNRASVNLTRLTTSGYFTVKGRIEGQTVYAEYFTGSTPPGTAVVSGSTLSYALTSGEQSSLVAGFSGWSWVPASSGSTLLQFDFRPFHWRDIVTPLLVDPLDEIPGTAPALATVRVTPPAGSTPIWALIAWINTLKPPASTALPVGLVEDNNSHVTVTGSGFTSGSQVNAHGGTDARGTGSVTGRFVYAMDPVNGIEADEFTDGLVDIEVWARAVVTDTTVSPKLTLSVQGIVSGTLFGDAQYSVEYGSAGRQVVVPASGAGTVYRFVRCGLVTVDIDAGQAIVLDAASSGGGAFGIDYVWLVPARRRASTITGVPASQISSFIPIGFAVTRRVQSDLSSDVAPDGVVVGNPVKAPGLEGALIQPNPGPVSWLLKLSQMVPDDPSSTSTSEQSTWTLTFGVDVVPRSFMLRSA